MAVVILVSGANSIGTISRFTGAFSGFDFCYTDRVVFAVVVLSKRQLFSAAAWSIGACAGIAVVARYFCVFLTAVSLTVTISAEVL